MEQNHPILCRRLVGEPEIHPERRIDKTLEALGRNLISVLGNGSHIGVIELDQFTVFFDARGSHRFGENRQATGNFFLVRRTTNNETRKGNRTYDAN